MFYISMVLSWRIIVYSLRFPNRNDIVPRQICSRTIFQRNYACGGKTSSAGAKAPADSTTERLAYEFVSLICIV